MGPGWQRCERPGSVRKRGRLRTALGAWAAGLALVAASCTSSGPASSNGDRGSDASAAPVALECETQGYPCSLPEVPAEIIERSDSLAGEALDRLEAGGRVADVAAWLMSHEGMAEVEADEAVIRFRLNGGRGTWIVRNAALGTRSSAGSGGAADGTLDRGATATSRSPISQPETSLQHIVGEPVDAKSAVVLSPFQWDFGTSDDGAGVAGILSATRGYEGRVRHIANPTADASSVGIDSFKGWDSLQVVHVVSHGFRICQESACRASIAAGTLTSTVPDQPGVEVKAAVLDLPDRGLELGEVENPCPPDEEEAGRCTRIKIVLLTADFFRAQYRGGLRDALVFFNGCNVFGSDATDLADAIRGTTSVFLGWDGAVDTNDAHDAALVLYEDLAGRGYPADEAFMRLDDLGTSVTGAQLRFGKRAAGGDLRIRDIVTLLEPETGQPLAAESQIPIDGQPRDGEEDGAPYLVQVDGVPERDAERAILHVAVDGVEAEPQPVASGERNERDEWRVSGHVPLGFDFEEDMTVSVRAWVELPSGGETDDESTARLVGLRPLVAVLSWTYTAQGVVQTTTGELVLRPVTDASLPEGRQRYEVTGGSWTWSHGGGIPGGCQYSSSGVSVDLAQNPDSAAGSFLIVDSTTTPATYWGSLTTIGPDASVTVTGCFPDTSSTYDRHTRTNWMTIDESDRQPVQQGPLITGRRTASTAVYTLESTWIIRGLE